MDDTIACPNISSNNLWHGIHVPRVASTLLKDTVVRANGTRVFTRSHFKKMRTAQVLGIQFMIRHDVEQQDAGQQIFIGKDCIEDTVGQRGESSVGRGKDCPGSLAQSTIQACCCHGSTEGREIICTASNFGNALACLALCRMEAQTTRDHNLIHNMNHTIASHDVGVNNFGHHITRVRSTLLVDFASGAYGTRILSVRHFN
mmetsp:Transcript_22218/g.35805  ORF Transcript_22218/g.35805 Transcript_22218/m.35805 type:complete len:202 (+) Transcript_22218:250-855(+)